jgi:hypothetical protein
MSNTKNADIEELAGLWIASKASTLFSNLEAREVAWATYERKLEFVIVKYNLDVDQLRTQLVSTAARLYSDQLKHEIFGYGEKVAA